MENQYANLEKTASTFADESTEPGCNKTQIGVLKEARVETKKAWLVTLLMALMFMMAIPFSASAQCPLAYQCTDHGAGDIDITFSFDAGNNAAHDNEVACNFIVRTGGSLIGGDETQCAGGSFTIDGITYNYDSRTSGGNGPIVLSYSSGVPHAPGSCPASNYAIAEAIGCADTSDDNCLSVIFSDELTGNNCTSSNSYFSMTLEDIGGCGPYTLVSSGNSALVFGTSSFTTGTYTTATIKAGTYVFVFTDASNNEKTFVYNHTTRTIDKCPFEAAEVFIDKTITSGDPYSSVGDIINYQFVVTTDVDISNVTVNDNKIPGGLATYSSGDINNDDILQTTESWTFTGSYPVTQADIDAGSVTNSAFARGLNGGLDIFSDTDEATATLEPCNIALTSVATDVSCFADGVNASDGSIAVTVTNGVAPLTYAWTGPDGFTDPGTEDLSGLSIAGLYSLTVTDANGCEANTEATIAVPADFTASAVVTDVSCVGDAPSNDGSITLTVTNAVGALSYAWTALDGGTGLVATDKDQTGLSAGNYRVVVTDATGGCTVTKDYEITAPDPLTVAGEETDVSCVGDAPSNDGSITLTVTNAVGALSYAWTALDGGTGLVATDKDQTGLSAGNYRVVVTDATGGCTVTKDYEITAPDPLTVAGEETDVSCVGDAPSNDGSITLTVTNAVGALSYAWTALDGGTGLVATDKDQTGLSAGNYRVVVTDATGGCTVTKDYEITAPDPLTVAGEETDVSCVGDAPSNDGSITLTVTNAVGALSYAWTALDGGTGLVATDKDQTGLSAGNYRVVVTDATGGCTVTKDYEITAPDPLTVAGEETDVSCVGDAPSNDGSITLTVTNAVGALSYAWTALDGGTGLVATDKDQTGLSAGNYRVVVTDATGGCTVTKDYEITAPDPLTVAGEETDVSCVGDAPSNDGSITLTVTNAVGALSYAWTALDGGTGLVATDKDQTGLSAGNYRVVVTDATGGCTVTKDYEITAPDPLTVAGEETDVSCVGDAPSNDGSITLTVTNAVGALSYAWTALDGGTGLVATDKDQTGLSAGNYRVVVTDATGGCTVTKDYEITAPDPLTVAGEETDVSCVGDAPSNDGSITLTVTNAVGALSYAWTALDGGTGLVATDKDQTGLSAGNYRVVVTDATGGCTVTKDYEITAPDPLTVAGEETDVSCVGDAPSNDGSITLTVTNAVGALSYAWTALDGGTGLVATDKDQTGLSAGNYRVVVTDATGGCTVTKDYEITAPDPLTVAGEETDVSCVGDAPSNDGSITLTVTNAVGALSYAWTALDGGTGLVATDKDQTGLSAGNYRVVVTDATGGCTVTKDYEITAPDPLTVAGEETDVSCVGDAPSNDGSITLTVTNAVGALSYAWTALDGGTGLVATDKDQTGLSAGNYRVVVTDATGGCTVTKDYEITAPDPLTVAGEETDVSCVGDAPSNDGSITLTVTNAVGALSYAWTALDGGTGLVATDKDQTGLSAGNYRVVVTDATGGCTVTKDYEITAPDPLTVAGEETDVSCVGDAPSNDGSITLTVTNAVGALSYAWTALDGGTGLVATDKDQTGLSAGNYRVVVTDATGGCTVTKDYEITAPDPLTVAGEETDVSCVGDAPSNDGSITLTVTNAVGALSYAWTALDGGTGLVATDKDQTGLSAGNYRVVVTDATGGCTVTKDYEITAPDPLTVAGEETDVSCVGDAPSNDGSITLTVTNAVGALSYAWTALDGGTGLVATDKDQTGLSAGNYRVVVTDATGGCTVTKDYEITAPDPLTVAGEETDVSCVGDAPSNDGSITLTVTNAVGALSYAWTALDGGTGLVATDKDQTGLSAGNYRVVVTDATGGCTVTKDYEITAPDPLTVAGEETDVSCVGDAPSNDGSITLTVTNAVGALSYAWTALDGGTGLVATDKDQTGLSAGNYRVVVTDATGGCTVTKDYEITAPDPLTVAGEETDVSCVGDAPSNDGSITLTVTNAVGALSYAWTALDGGTGLVATDKDQTGLSAGNYRVVVTDATGGCTVTKDYEITAPDPLTVAGEETDVSCVGDAPSNDGSITLTVTNAVGALSYAWTALDGGTGLVATDKDQTGLSAGNYRVVVTDATGGCTVTKDYEITAPDPLTVAGEETDVSCVGDAPSNDGSITLTVTNAVGALSYAWTALDGGTGLVATDKDQTGLSAGNYRVVVTDATGGCTVTKDYEITAPDPLTVAGEETDVSCVGDAPSNDGSITLTVTNAVGALSYAWTALDGGTGLVATDKDQTGLSAGNYRVVVTDATGGCTVTKDYEITAPDPLTVAGEETDVSCVGDAPSNDGSITLTVTNAVGALSYAWTALDGGTGLVATDKDQTGLSAGNYRVVVTDATGGCTVTKDYEITAPDPLTVAGEETDVSCVGDAPSNDGSITLTVTNAVGALSYAWTALDGGTGLVATDKDQTGLSAGNYRVVVTDATGGCTVTKDYEITAPDPLTVAGEETDVSCVGDAPSNDGSITLTVTNAVGALSYAWTALDGGTGLVATDKDQTGLSAGNYRVVVTDATGGCTVTKDYEITAPDPLTVAGEETDVSCVGDAPSNDGSITLTVTNAVGALSYAWTALDGGTGLVATDKDQTGLSAGNYRVVVTDATGGCTVTKDYEITAPDPLTVAGEETDVSCVGDAPSNDGSITLTVTNAVGALSYAWTALDGGTGLVATDKDQTGLSAGNYRVVVTDATGGCTVTKDYEITAPDPLTVAGEETDVSCVGDAPSNDGSITLTVTNAVGALSYAWTALDGGTGLVATDKDQTGLSAGNYRVVVTDATGGCTVTKDYEITAPDPLTVAGEETDVSCVGDAPSNDGSITLTVTNAVGALSYAWTALDGGTGLVATDKDQTGLSAGNYRVVVTDATGGCTVTKDYEITAPDPLTVAGEETDVSCVGDAPSNDGSITLTVTNAVGALSYAWTALDGGTGLVATDKDQTGLSAGNYRVVVTDATGGCTVTKDYEITAPDPLTVAGEETDVSCVGDAPSNDGSITLTVTNAVGALSYAWTALDGGTGLVATDKDQTGLSAGNYRVVVTDATGGCTVTKDYEITAPDPLTVAGEETDVSCVGDAPSNDGSITLTVTNAVGALSYAWTALDGGTGLVATDKDQTGLSAGNYRVVVTDATGGCTVTKDYEITAPDPLTVAGEETDVSCVGDAPSNDGSITLTVTNAVGALSYAWTALDGGTGLVATDKDQTGLSAGNYRVVVTDATGGCTVTKDYEITAPDPLTVAGEETDVSCVGDAPSNDGSITLTVTNAVGALSYAWTALDGGTGLVATDKDQTGLSAGNYRVVVTDATGGCTVTKDYEITAPDPLTVAGEETDVSCVGDAPSNDGSITLTVTNAVGALSYAWTALDGGTGLVATDKDQTGLSAGNYRVVVTDATGGCTVTKDYEITAPDPLTVAGEETDVSCVGDAPSNDGSITLTVTNAVGALSYAWTALDGGTGLVATDKDQTGLSAGNYRVVVTDATGGCTVTKDYEITAPDPLTVAGEETDVSCVGDAPSNDGSITLTVTNAVGALSYAWTALDGGTGLVATDKDQTGLSAGNYRVVVTDATGGCTVTKDYEITAPDPLVATLAPTDVSCVDDGGPSSDGSITVTNASTTATYSWVNDTAPLVEISTDKNLTGVLPGDYTVTITDGACTLVRSATIGQPADFTATAVATVMVCNEGVNPSDGSIAVTVNNGVGAFTYSWTGPDGFTASTKDLSGLSEPGTYELTVTDENGCVATTEAIIKLACILTEKVLDNIDDGTLTEYTTVGQVINYTITLENNGSVPVYDPTMADATADAAPVRGTDAPGNGDDVLNVGETWTYTASHSVTQADLDNGSYANTAEGSGSADTDGDQQGDTLVESDDDETVNADQDPAIKIVKTFADDAVTAGGTGSSFTLVVTNEGNVTLSDAEILDIVDNRLTVTGVSGTAGSADDSDLDDQTVEWLITSLAPGDSETITVDFSVAADVPEANGVGALNDEDNVPNDATVAAEAPQGDPNDSTDDIEDDSTDNIDIVVDIDLDIVKTFDPSQIESPQGTRQFFTIVVTNNGPSDAVDVSVTDTVDDLLEVIDGSVVIDNTVTSGTGDCTNSAGQKVDCTVQIPTGESATINVEYMTAPFLDDPSPYNNTTAGGDDFYFKFVNGSVLEGTTRGAGLVLLDGVDITSTTDIVRSLTRNDIIFDPDGPGGDPAFELHLSCSDPFTGGWGQSAGPVEGVDVNWQIAFFTIARYNNNGYLKSCGNVVNDFEVSNTADTSGEDTFGTETATNTAFVTVGPGIILDRLQTNGKRLTVRLNNLTGMDKDIAEITAVWPEGNGDLTKVWLTYDGISDVVWSGRDAWLGNEDDPKIPDAILDDSDSGWIGRTLFTGEAILRFDFANKVASKGYVIRVWFTDGTWLDISVLGDESGGGGGPKGRDKSSKSVEDTFTGETRTTLTASPIPFKDRLSLKMEVEYASPARIEIFDLSGRLILSKTEYINEGTNVFDVSEVFRIPTKLSIIRVTTNRETIMQKVVSFNQK